MPSFGIEHTVIGKITGDGECARFLYKDGKLVYLEEIFLPPTYEEFSEEFERAYRRRVPEWDGYHNSKPWVMIHIKVDITPMTEGQS